MNSDPEGAEATHDVDMLAGGQAMTFSSDSVFRLRTPRRVRLLSLLLFFLFFLFGWIVWEGSPEPKHAAAPWNPDAIVSLGGGNHERNRESFRSHQRFPRAPVVVSGDNGSILGFLVGKGVPSTLLYHEDQAESTIENARFTKGILDELDAKRVLIVTDGYHARRALGAFRREQPEREFAVTFEARSGSPSSSYKNSQRRERFAAIWYLLRYGVWSW